MGISVLMPSYNYGHFITEAVNSFLNQGNSDQYELIIQDGNSSDATLKELANFPHDRIKCISQKDSGQSDALNRALQRANFEIIGWLNSDEFYLPGALDLVDHFFDEHPEVDVLFGDCLLIDEQGKAIRLLPAHKFSEFTLRKYGCFISSCATFMRKSSIGSSPWNPNIRTAMDWDLWLRLSVQGKKFQYLPKVFAAFRVHAAQITATPLDAGSWEVEYFQKNYDSRLTGRKSFSGRIAHGVLKLISGAYKRQLLFFIKQRNRQITINSDFN